MIIGTCIVKEPVLALKVGELPAGRVAARFDLKVSELLVLETEIRRRDGVAPHLDDLHRTKGMRRSAHSVRARV